jgi:hypothetical protein
MTVTDEEAWSLAIEMMRHSGEAVWASNIDNMLQSHGLIEAGQYAAHAMQFRSLRSRPWLTLPCDLSDADVESILAAGDDGRDLCGEYAAAVLARRLLHYGISKWHPDPRAALRDAERKPAA